MRALLLAGLKLPCDAGRLQCRSSTERGERGERRGGIASGPAVAAGLLFVGGETGAGLPPTFVEVCRVRHGPLSYAADFSVLVEKSSLKKTLVPFAVTKTPHFDFA